ADRDRLAAQNEKWFYAAVTWAADRLLGAPRSRRGRPFHRLMLRAGRIRRSIRPANHKNSGRRLATRARDAREWELAARFYVDELNKNVHDPATWVELGHVLKEAGKTSAAEIAYRRAAALCGKNH